MENPFSCPFISTHTHTHDVAGSGGAALTVDDDELYFCPQPKKERGGGGNVLLLSVDDCLICTHISLKISFFFKCFFGWPAAGQFGSYWKGRENSIGDVGNDTPRGEDNPAAGKKKEQKKVLQSEVHIIPDDVADSLSVKQL
jgi:hypothetical protein